MISYTWAFEAICARDEAGLSDVVRSFAVRVTANDTASGQSADWLGAVEALADPDPDGFIPFPTTSAEVADFLAAMKTWALDWFAATEAEIEQRALAQLQALQALPQPKALP